MKIAINAIPYVRWSGIETFLYNLLKNWPQNSQDEVVVFTNQTFTSLLSGLPGHIKIETINFKKTNRLSFFIYQQLHFPRLLKSSGFDLLFCASLLTPWFFKKKITAIHDAAPFVLKDENSLLSKIFWRLNLFFGLRTSLKIITVSEFSKQELIKYLKIKADKIEVVYNGAPQINTTTYSQLVEKEKYLITVGNARPRKNLETLFKAMAIIKTNFPDLKLLVVGKMDERMSALKNKYSNENIIFKGFIEEQEKYNLIKNSIALIFPSLYEGFGLPIVEAGILKTPVICSDIPSFREIATDSALFFNAESAQDLGEKIKAVVSSKKIAENMGNKGLINTQRFSWQKSAEKLSAIIHSYETPANK